MKFLQASDNPVTTYEYIEMQSTNDNGEAATTANEPLGVKIFSALIIPFLLTCILVWLLMQIKKKSDIARDSKQMTSENTEATKTNNELLRENIRLQRELLAAIQRNVK